MLICFKCARLNCRKMPVNGRCPEYEPAPWKRYVSIEKLAVLDRGGIRQKKKGIKIPNP